MSISNLVPEPEKPEVEDSPKENAASDVSSPSEKDSPAENVPSSDSDTSKESGATKAPLGGTADSVPAESPANTAQSTTSVTTPVDREQEVTNALFRRLGDVGTKTNFKVLIYGPPGGTKSSFLDVPNNLIYDQEDGLISMKSWAMMNNRRLSPGIKTIPFQSFVQADLLLDRLTKRVPELESFEVFSIDTMNDFHKKSLSSLVRKQFDESPAGKNEWVPVVEQHSENNEKILDFVRRLRDLDRNIILTAHSKTVEPKNKAAKTYPDFSESLANKIEAMMDVVGYMEMMEEDGEFFPVLRTKSDGTVHAKCRVPLPPLIKNPTYQMLKDAWLKVQDYDNQE